MSKLLADVTKLSKKVNSLLSDSKRGVPGSLKESIIRLKQENRLLKAENESLKGKDIEAEMETTSREILELTETLREKEAKLTTIQEENIKLASLLSLKTAKIEEDNNKIADLEEELSSKKEEINLLKQAEEISELEIEGFKNQIEELKQQVEDSTETVSYYEEQIELLSKQKQSFRGLTEVNTVTTAFPETIKEVNEEQLVSNRIKSETSWTIKGIDLVEQNMDNTKAFLEDKFKVSLKYEHKNAQKKKINFIKEMLKIVIESKEKIASNSEVLDFLQESLLKAGVQFEEDFSLEENLKGGIECLLEALSKDQSQLSIIKEEDKQIEEVKTALVALINKHAEVDSEELAAKMQEEKGIVEVIEMIDELLGQNSNSEEMEAMRSDLQNTGQLVEEILETNFPEKLAEIKEEEATLELYIKLLWDETAALIEQPVDPDTHIIVGSKSVSDRTWYLLTTKPEPTEESIFIWKQESEVNAVDFEKFSSGEEGEDTQLDLETKVNAIRGLFQEVIGDIKLTFSLN